MFSPKLLIMGIDILLFYPSRTVAEIRLPLTLTHLLMENNIYLSVAFHGCYVGNSLKQRLSLHKVDFIFNFFFLLHS